MLKTVVQSLLMLIIINKADDAINKVLFNYSVTATGLSMDQLFSPAPRWAKPLVYELITSMIQRIILQDSLNFNVSINDIWLGLDS